MRAVLFLALVLLAQSASAVEQFSPPTGAVYMTKGPNVGILQPAADQSGPAFGCGGGPCPNGINSACVSPPCDAPTKPMKPAVVEPTDNCFCHDQPDCACKPETVEPEVREVPCACLGQPNCGCRSNGNGQYFHTVAVQDGCGCMHLEVCPCRPHFVEPEVKDNHLQPELKEGVSNACGCMMDPVCACRQVETVTPEIKDPPCPCLDTLLNNCACQGLASNRRFH